MSALESHEVFALAVFAAPGGVAGLVGLGCVLRERRARTRRLGEVRYLKEMLRLDDEAHSPVLRELYQARLDEAVDALTIDDCRRDPEMKEEMYAYLRRLKYTGDAVELLRPQTDEEDRQA